MADDDLLAEDPFGNNVPRPGDARAREKSWTGPTESYTERDDAEWTYQTLYADSRAPSERRKRRK